MKNLLETAVSFLQVHLSQWPGATISMLLQSAEWMSGGTKASLKGLWCLGRRNSYGVWSGTRRGIQEQDGSQAIQDIPRLESRVILGKGHVDSRIQVYLKSDLYMATVHSLNVKVAYGAYQYARLLRILMSHCRCSLQWQIQEAPLIRYLWRNVDKALSSPSGQDWTSRLNIKECP